MSQARVTEYFSTRKRNRFQDDALINKTKKSTHTESVTEASPTKRCLRSSRLKSGQTETESTKSVVEVAPVEKPRRGAVRSEKKENIEALKARMRRLDDMKSKISPGPIETVAEAPVEPKKKLNKAELKRRIEDFNRNLAQLQTQEPEKEVEKPKESQVVESAPLPAHLKSKDLASEQIDLTTTLTLPKIYSMLMDHFKGSDTIVKFLFNRDEVCTFLKLKMGIQNITKQTFGLKQLGQIKSVYPQAYIMKYEKLFIDFKNDYHLIISPNLEEIETNPETGTKQFTPNVLLKRLTKFKTNLFTIVRKLHQEFLESIGIKEVSSESIRRWHPKFDLENVKDIEPAELPKAPTDESIKCKTGQELLNIARDIYSSRIQDAIKKTVPDGDKNKEIVPPAIELKVTIEKAGKELDTKVTGTNNQYSALLEKIRNKEKQKAFETMVIHSDKEKSSVKYRVYSEATRLVVNFFQSEKKTTLDIDKVSRKMCENLKTTVLNEFECKELLMEMSSPDSIFGASGKKWLNIIKVRGQSYLQWDKTVQLNDLTSICEDAIKNLK